MAMYGQAEAMRDFAAVVNKAVTPPVFAECQFLEPIFRNLPELTWKDHFRRKQRICLPVITVK